MTTPVAEHAYLQHRPRVVQILAVVDEAPHVRSLSFRDKSSATAKPGQFGMVWAPGTDESPMSLLPLGNNDGVTITVKERGEGTRALLGKKRRELIGIRGPYGKGFTYGGGRSILMIGGGTGAVPLLALLRSLAPKGVECNFILGANTSHELLFSTEIQRLCTQNGGFFRVTTDDGSAGTRGLATDEAARLLRARTFDSVYTCGPEAMMKRTIDLAEHVHVPAQAGLERIFKCGSGICGSCCIGPYLVCKDGPVFSSEILKGLPEFGKSTRDASGRPVRLPRS